MKQASLVIFLVCLLPLIQADLFSPKLVSQFFIPDVNYTPILADTLFADDQYIYLTVQQDGSYNITLYVLNYTQDGLVDVVRTYELDDILPISNRLPHNVVVPSPGIVVLASADQFITNITLIDVARDAIEVTQINESLYLSTIVPIHNKYALSAVSPFSNTTLYLFVWENGTMSLEPVTITMPREFFILFVGTYIHELTEKGTILCSYKLDPLDFTPLNCINLTASADVVCHYECGPYGDDRCCYFNHAFSQSGDRVFLYELMGMTGHDTVILDVTDNGLELFSMLNPPMVDIAYITQDAFAISYHADFVLNEGVYLYDVSSSGQLTLAYSFYNYANDRYICGAISPNDKFVFIATAGRIDPDPLQIMTFNIAPALSPSHMGIASDITEYILCLNGCDSKLVVDEGTGLGFLPSYYDPFIFAIQMDELGATKYFPVPNHEIEVNWGGRLFKDQNCSWFSKVDFQTVDAGIANWSASFFLFNQTSKSFYSTIVINSQSDENSQSNPYVVPITVIPVARRLWIGASGDYYIAVLWANSTTDINGYSDVKLAVYQIEQTNAFPIETSSPNATLQLGHCIIPEFVFSEDYLNDLMNLYTALWSTEAENLTTEGGFSFSTVVGISGQPAYSWLTFEYNETTTTITLVQNITIESTCKLFQSIRLNNSTWILCEEDNYYQVRQYTSDLEQPAKLLKSVSFYNQTRYNFLFNWFLSNDEQRLAIVNATGAYVMEIPSMELSYYIDTGVAYVAGGLYHITSPHSSYVLAIMDYLGTNMYYDCPIGTKPNPSNYCSQCNPGYYGFGCMLCPPGYICDGYGLAAPSTLCPAGFYCEEGTSSSVAGDDGPKPCLAGTYCPTGMGTSVVGTDRTSPKYCTARFYCPPESTIPTAVACPELTISDIGAKSIEDCKCEQGYFGNNGNCIKCPVQCKCFGNVISGCWINSNSTATPILCPRNSALSTTACNPNFTEWDGNSPFPCKAGYGDRQCSKCDPGYFASGRVCDACNEKLKVMLPMAYIVALVVMLIYAWNIRPANSASFKIVTVHFQSLLIFVVGGMEWDSITSKFIHSSATSFNFSLSAIECLIPSWKLLQSLLAAVLLPFAIGIFSLVAGVVVWFWRRVKGRIQRRIGIEDLPEDTPRLPIQVVKTMVTLMDLLYFSVALMTFQMLGCTPTSGRLYLTSYPWLQCDKHSWVPYLTIAIIALVLEVIAPPLLLLGALRRNKNHLLSKNTKSVLGSFYLVYTQENYFWEGVVISRRLIIACLSTVIPYGSVILFIALFLVFHLYAVALLRRMPYINRRDNILDTASQCILLTTLYCGFFVDFAAQSIQQLQISYFAGAANLIFMICGAFCILFENVPAMALRIYGWIPRLRASVPPTATVEEESASLLNEEIDEEIVEETL